MVKRELNRRRQTPSALLIVLMAAVTVLFAFPSQARALTNNDVFVQSPAPYSTYAYDTPLVFEVRLENASVAGNYTIDVDWDWIGIGDAASWLGAIGVVTGDTDATGTASLTGDAVQYRFSATHAYPPSAGAIGYFRFRITPPGTTVSVYGSGAISLKSRVDFINALYLGASTGVCVGPNSTGEQCRTDADCFGGGVGEDRCGKDALGWLSLSCANRYDEDQSRDCTGTLPTYAMSYGKANSSTNDSLLNNGWISSITDSPPSMGWLTFTKGICKSGASLGNACTQDAQCDGTPGSCDLTGTPPAGDPEDSIWQSALGKEINKAYSSYETVNSGQRYPDQVAGWARFLTMRDYGQSAYGENDWGWVHLRGASAPTKFCIGGPNNGQACTDSAQCQPPKGTCKNASAQFSDLSTGGFQQCLDCATANNTGEIGRCNICTTVAIDKICTQSDDVNELTTACDTDADCGTNGVCTPQNRNYACNSCTTCQQTGSAVACSACAACDLYGVSYNPQGQQLVGYAWAGGDAERSGVNNYPGGLGWVQFNTVYSTSSALQAWLETRYGDIFTSGKAGPASQTTPPAPAGQTNAYYLIQANGQVTFTTRATGLIQEDYPQIALPDVAHNYVNVLGKLDFNEMVPADPDSFVIGDTKPNRYGTTVALSSNQISAWKASSNGNVLSNSVDYPDLVGSSLIYYHHGDLTINDALLFKQGNATAANGAATIIVDGDLHLNADITYDSTAISDGKVAKVPSVAWLVRGNVSVAPAVQNLAGTFFVVGCSTSVAACGGVDKAGIFATGDDISSPATLTVSGLLMAKQFNFQRTAIDAEHGSERVVYDGRFLANPPPGLQALSALLPSIRDVIP